MKLTIAKTEFLKGLSRIQSIVDRRAPMPILAHVLIEEGENSTAEAKGLALSATDLEVGIRSFHAAEVEEPGSLTVSAKKLFDLIRELPDETVHLEDTDNSYLDLRCARAHFTLAGSSAEEYPTLPDFASDRTFSVSAPVLSSMIERTLYAASTDETRYNLNGVQLEVLPESGKIRMVATDGHRLAIIDRTLTEESDRVQSGVIIPRKGIAELKRLVDEDDADQIELAFEENSGLARKGDVALAISLIEGEFPNYRQVIPDQPGVQLTIPSDLLVHSLRRVSVLSTDRGSPVKFELTSGQMTLSCSSPDLGEARDEVDVDYDGDPVLFGFNAAYLLDALLASHAKEIRLSIQDDLSPARIVPTDDDDTLAVVMPMRI